MYYPFHLINVLSFIIFFLNLVFMEIMSFSFACFIGFSSVAHSCLTFCDRINCSTPGLLSITNAQSSPKPMSIESLMPSKHLILCRPLLLMPSVPLGIFFLAFDSTVKIIFLSQHLPGRLWDVFVYIWDRFIKYNIQKALYDIIFHKLCTSCNLTQFNFRDFNIQLSLSQILL